MTDRFLGLAVGDEPPPFVRETDFAAWNRYAAVNDEFVTIHMADDLAQQTGLPGAIGMGNLQVSYLHAMLWDWLAHRGAVLSLACSHRAHNRRGDTLSARGRISAIRGGEADLELWVENQRGERLSVGDATVRLGTFAPRA